MSELNKYDKPCWQLQKKEKQKIKSTLVSEMAQQSCEEISGNEHLRYIT